MLLNRAVFAVTLCASAAFASANLVFNGSFEANTVVNNGGADDRADGWSNFTDVSGLSSPDVWDNGGVDGLAPGSFGFFGQLLAYDGTNMASIASNGSGFSEGVESTAMALTSGTTYQLSVRMAYDSTNTAPWVNPATLTFRLRQGANSSSVMAILPMNTMDATWELRTFTFTIGASDNYSVILSSEQYVPDNFFVIDDVSVESVVPEPMSILVLGGSALALIARRRNKM